MSRARVTLLLLAAFLVGGSCGGGDGGGSGSIRSVGSLDPRCLTVSSPFPVGFAIVPGGADLGWVIDFSPPTLIPIDASSVPPAVSTLPGPLVFPIDSDGNGVNEAFLAPVPDDLVIPRADLGLITASGYEEVIFLDPATGTLRNFDVSVPAAFAPSDFPLLPAPGTTGSRTAVSTFGCVRPPPGALDSRGAPIALTVPAAGFCDAATPSYLASFTSGAALVADRLFVSSSNLGDDAGSANPQFLPGSVLVYDVDLAMTPPRISPHATRPVVLTSAFNPTHVTPFETGGRRFALVSQTGSIGIEPDDPNTLPIEAAAISLTDSAIDVIDADTLSVVATIPLAGAALAFDGIAIDPTGRVGVAGSAAQRWVFAIDLEPLATLPTNPGTPLVLDGSTGPDVILFDGDAPFQIPARSDGADSESCAGFTRGVAFNDAGDVLYVSDFCDGTLTLVDVSLDGGAPSPSQFQFNDQFNITAALRSDTLGLPRSPSAVTVRPGEPGIDFTGPDVIFSVGEPGLLCGVAIESP